MRQPFSVHVFLYRYQEAEPEYLILYRFPMPQINLPSFWQGVSGGLEDDETFEDAAIREVYEETGIIISKPRESGFIHTFPVQPEWRDLYGKGPSHIEEHTFYSEAGTDPIFLTEHSQFKWVNFKTAEKYLTQYRIFDSLKSVDEILNV